MICEKYGTMYFCYNVRVDMKKNILGMGFTMVEAIKAALRHYQMEEMELEYEIQHRHDGDYSCQYMKETEDALTVPTPAVDEGQPSPTDYLGKGI